LKECGRNPFQKLPQKLWNQEITPEILGINALKRRLAQKALSQEGSQDIQELRPKKETQRKN